jgi:hypothetical protein
MRSQHDENPTERLQHNKHTLESRTSRTETL